MSSMQQQYLKALNPTMTIQIKSLDNKSVPPDLLKGVQRFISYTYRSYLDIENGVIYVEKKG